MGNRLAGKVAIVTGAGRGIGRAEALALAAEGAAVIINDLGVGMQDLHLDQTPAKAVVDEIRSAGGQASANYDDVASYQGAKRLVQQAIDEYGRLDILVNNAGVLRDRMVFNMTEEEWDIVIAVHLKGHFNTIRHASAYFREAGSGGAIVNTSSEAGIRSPGQVNYASAKEGIIGMTRSVAAAMARYGVRCNAIRPRAGTRMTQSAGTRAMVEQGLRNWDRLTEEQRARVRMARQILEASPDAVAGLVTWLCTDAARHITGRTFFVFGDEVGLYREPELAVLLQAEGGWTLDKMDERFPALFQPYL